MVQTVKIPSFQNELVTPLKGRKTEASCKEVYELIIICQDWKVRSGADQFCLLHSAECRSFNSEDKVCWAAPP